MGLLYSSISQLVWPCMSCVKNLPVGKIQNVKPCSSGDREELLWNDTHPGIHNNSKVIERNCFGLHVSQNRRTGLLTQGSDKCEVYVP